MKIYIRLFFVSLLMNFLFINFTLCNELIEHKFIVKIKPNTSKSELAKILDNHLKDYKISTFISPENLNFLSKKLQNHKLIINQTLNDYKLHNIYLIEFKDLINPIQLSNKIKSYDNVEYSEPLFDRHIFYENYPNDSLLYKQYYLMNCKVFEAIKLLKNNTDSVIIGVVDTGVDYTHEDLKGQMYNNKGETGLDSNGNDKTTNKIDDDNNGYIDDWMGWDFGSSDSLGYDNDPIPGNAHGTHVSGIITAITDNDIGIAGINPFAKILPVKIGGDSPWSRNLVNSYDGLLYAGLAGAQIINCSWGGGGFSQAEQDVVNQVLSLGSVIVAAAGNNYENGAFYPASYKGVVSVAALTSSDTKANFSNYHYKKV